MYPESVNTDYNERHSTTFLGLYILVNVFIILCFLNINILIAAKQPSTATVESHSTALSILSMVFGRQ